MPRFTITSLLVVAVLVAGCGAFPSQTENARIEAYEVDEVPTNATVVNATDERIANVEPVQQALRQVTANDSTRITVRVAEDDYEHVSKRLEKLPTADDGYHYVAYRGQVVQVALLTDD